MKARAKPKAVSIETLDQCEVGDIVRVDLLVRVGPDLSGAKFSRLVAVDGEGYRDASEPVHLAGTTRVLEIIRGRGHYEAHKRAGGGSVDPLRGVR